MSQRPRILVVEDNPADLYLIRDAIRQAAIDVDVHTAGDGEKAIRFFSETEPQPCPTLVLLGHQPPETPRSRGA